MPVKPDWLRNLLSVAFSGYYLVFAHEADEKVSSFLTFNSKTRADSLRTAEEVSSGVHGRNAENDLGEDVESVYSIRYSRRSTSNWHQQATPSASTERIHLLVRITRPHCEYGLNDSCRKPITAWLFFAGTEEELAKARDLIFDMPGGGFICMTPEHHEERLLRWAVKTKRPVLSFDYGKVSFSALLKLAGIEIDSGSRVSVPVRH